MILSALVSCVFLTSASAQQRAKKPVGPSEKPVIDAILRIHPKIMNLEVIIASRLTKTQLEELRTNFQITTSTAMFRHSAQTANFVLYKNPENDVQIGPEFWPGLVLDTSTLNVAQRRNAARALANLDNVGTLRLPEVQTYLGLSAVQKKKFAQISSASPLLTEEEVVSPIEKTAGLFAQVNNAYEMAVEKALTAGEFDALTAQFADAIKKLIALKQEEEVTRKSANRFKVFFALLTPAQQAKWRAFATIEARKPDF
ncbi:hypothetical protein MCEMSE15_00915 [Fimbriimonadaceae bacterium]